MLGLTITGEDPDEMARALNCIADNYLQQNVARQAAQDAKSLQFLKQQLPQVRSELDAGRGEAQPLSPAKRLR